jgi:hypothetical protein
VEVMPFSPFQTFRRRAAPTSELVARSSTDGVHFQAFHPPGGRARESERELEGLLTQLRDDGYLDETSGAVRLSWQSYFEAVQTPGYATLRDDLDLPADTDLQIALRSANAITDPGFSIGITWRQDGIEVFPAVDGAIVTLDNCSGIMRPSQWRLAAAVQAFARRSHGLRKESDQRQSWGQIRRLAQSAGAYLDDFLYRTVILTPERLDIGLRRSDVVSGDHVIEIVPGFSGAPPQWLPEFDRRHGVEDRYDLPTADGIVQILIAPKVRTVLEEIKRLPGRRVAGARAQAFIVNPFAALGDDATDVIAESQFEAAREAAGLHYECFVPVVEHNPLRVGLLIETATQSGALTSETEWFGEGELPEFIAKVEGAIAHEHQLISWRGYELEVQGDIAEHLKTLRAAERPTAPAEPGIRYTEVHDLTAYSPRIDGIGVEKRYYSPYIAKKNDGEGWFPENVLAVIAHNPQDGADPIGIPATSDNLKELATATAEACSVGQASVSMPWLPGPMPVGDAGRILKTFDEAFAEIETGTFRAERGSDGAPPRPKRLILKPNIETLDYEEARREALAAPANEPELPKNLNEDVRLLAHQETGVAWLQRLYRSRETFATRGAVLADDMGLGKTLQILVLLAWAFEADQSLEPALVVAPLSLLENWQEEVSRFFKAGSFKILTAYGANLAALRVPRALIEQRLQSEDGLVKFLRPGWRGEANIVLTTYETLRDLEFSFAAERWSIMVCDEAQKIKNPAAMVSRSAKKQNVRFRIACTGTPVENTLADLWCLFDFVQPGMLSTLNDFGRTYRRPIEAKTDEERARVEELRERIAPQILRRTKAEVAKDLPRKVEDDGCRRLVLSQLQRALYANAIETFRQRNNPGVHSPIKNHLGLLHYLRLICTDPRRLGLTTFVPEPLAEYTAKSPKLEWLLAVLRTVQTKGEKAIIFCEFRPIQRLLQHYIEEALRYRCDIINGDTSASEASAGSRQKRIRAFSEQPGFGAIILSPLAVGFGLNIQAANHVIHYTRTWNPAKEDQATDRAYRIGQRREVIVYYPTVTAADFTTFDVKLDELLTLKRGLAHDMLNGSGDLKPGEFVVSEVVPQAQAIGLDEAVTLDVALRMDWRYFEGLVTVLWRKQGFDCRLTPSTNDNGVDVVALCGAAGELLQVKTSEGRSHLGWDAVKEVVAGAAHYQRLYRGTHLAKVCVTNQRFNSQAHESAALNDVRLVEREDIETLLTRYTVTMSEVESALCPTFEDSAGMPGVTAPVSA